MLGALWVAPRARPEDPALASGRPSKAAASRSPAGRWAWLLALASLLLALPILALPVLALQGSGALWPHLAAYVLPQAARTTALLLAGVGLLSVIIGVGTAWLVTMYRFPGRAAFEWLLLLPLAMPTYVSAYTYLEVLDTLGPVQSGLRALFGWRSRAEYWFPEIRSLAGAVVAMSLVLFPYVYLTVRVSFLTQSAQPLEVARTLGSGAWGAFWRVALPSAKPALASGAALAMLEALGDFGAVQFFGVQTLTVAVYATWANRGSLPGAAQIACVMLLAVVALLALERLSRRGRRYHARGRPTPPAGRQLGPAGAAGAVLACSLPVALGFAVPAAYLAAAALRRAGDTLEFDYGALAGRSFVLAVAAALVTVLLGTVLAYGQRVLRHRAADAAVRLAGLGYALPGTVLAIGVLYPLAGFDNALDALLRQTFGISTGLLLSGTAFALLFAYAVRFLTVAHGAVEAGLGRINPHLDMAARSLGRNLGETLRQIHLPLLRPAVVTAALLVFVEVMKELPATLLLRPLGFETLATAVYAAASREAFEDGALAALTIVAVGLVPTALLVRTSRVRQRAVREPAAPIPLPP